MPALVLLGQPTIVSGDDIRWSCILLILLRLLQMAVGIPFLFYVINFSKHHRNINDNINNNNNGTTMPETPIIPDYRECIQEQSFSSPLVSKGRMIAISYGAMTLFLAVSSIVLEAFIWRTSLLGTPTQPEKRKDLKCLCLIKLVPGSLLRIITMFLGLVSIFILKKFCQCQHYLNDDGGGESDNNDNIDNLRNRIHDILGTGGLCGGNFYRVRLLLIILTISHMTEVCLAAFIHVFILFASARGKYHVFQLMRRCMIQTLGCCRGGGGGGGTQGSAVARANNNMDGSGWQCFCSCCFALTSLLTCCLLGGRQAATADFRDISMALVTFLDDGGHLDITISDVLCALAVLHKQHHEQRHARIDRIKDQILIEQLSSRQNDDHRFIMNSDSNDAASAAAAGVEPSRARKLGAGRLGNGDDEQVVDLEVVMLTDSSKEGSTIDRRNSQQQQQGDNDVERGQQAPRAPTMFRWTLQRDNTENNNNNFNVNSTITRFQKQERTLLSPSDCKAKQTIAAGAHFMRLAWAIYGPSLIPVAQPCQGALCLLGWDACCMTPCHRRRQRHQRRHTNSNNSAVTEVLGDNPCACNENTLLREANLTMDDIAYAAFHSSVDTNPYCIIIDRPWKSIVVVIRGSLSLDSIVTDLALLPVRLVTGHDDDKAANTDDEKTSSRQVYCHSGMLQTAQWIYKDLQRHGILEKLILDEKAPHADYRLVLTGHSLGAGLAAILAIMLRPKFPTLKCFCFAPPGCTLSDNALEAATSAAPSVDSNSKIDGDNNNADVDTKHGNVNDADDDFITSYAVGSDIIPRMSLEAMESFRDDVLETIARIKVNKVQAMGGSSLEVSDLMHREESIPRTKFHEQLLAFWAHQATVHEASPIGIVKLRLPPGKMVHFVNTTTKSSRRSVDSIRTSADAVSMTGHSSSYTAIWAERHDFSEIQLSASMLGNHYPWTALSIMEQIATEQFGLQAPHFVPG